MKIHLLVLKKEPLHCFGEYMIVNCVDFLVTMFVSLSCVSHFPHIFLGKRNVFFAYTRVLMTVVMSSSQEKYPLSVQGRNAQLVPGMSEALRSVSSTDKIKRT